MICPLAPKHLEAGNIESYCVTFYGYVRGSHFKSGMKVHLIGVGDYDVADISVLNDPCPIHDSSSDKEPIVSSR